jgi:hypothetical protein
MNPNIQSRSRYYYSRKPQTRDNILYASPCSPQRPYYVSDLSRRSRLIFRTFILELQIYFYNPCDLHEFFNLNITDMLSESG